MRKGICLARDIVVLYEDTAFPNAVARVTLGHAKKRGLQVVAQEGYPRSTKDFAPLLSKFKGADPDVIAVAAYYDDAVAVTRGVKDVDLNPKMLARC